MEVRLYLLMVKIEYYRDRLLYLLSSNIATSSAVVDCSQKLDEYIVDYEKVKIEYKKCTYKKAS